MGSFTFTHEKPVFVLKRTIPFSLSFTLTGQPPVGRVRIVHLRTHQGDDQRTMIGELAISANGQAVVELSGHGAKHRAREFDPHVLGRVASDYTVGYAGGALTVFAMPPAGGAFATELKPPDGAEIEVVFGIEDGHDLQPPIGMTLTGDFLAEQQTEPRDVPPQPPTPTEPPAHGQTDERAAREKLIQAAEEYLAIRTGVDPLIADLIPLLINRLAK